MADTAVQVRSQEHVSVFRKEKSVNKSKVYSFVLGGLVVSLVSGCATSSITSHSRYAGKEQLAKPGRIVVHDFVATPDDVVPGSAMDGQYERREKGQSAKDVALGRQLGSLVAADLVKRIRGFGLAAERGTGRYLAVVGDVVIRGEFVSITKGSRMKRMVIGFGAGAADIQTHVEGVVLTESGQRQLGEATVQAAGGKMPGMLVPVAAGASAGRAVTSVAVSGAMNIKGEMGSESIQGAAERTSEKIAELLKAQFARQGWIQN
jgi:hypothetical protein